MNTEEPLDFDDLGEALREGRALRPARGYRIRFAQDDLNFRDLDVADPVPLGRQSLTAAGRDPHDGYSLLPSCRPAISRMSGLMSRLICASGVPNGSSPSRPTATSN